MSLLDTKYRFANLIVISSEIHLFHVLNFMKTKFLQQIANYYFNFWHRKSHSNTLAWAPKAIQFLFWIAAQLRNLKFFECWLEFELLCFHFPTSFYLSFSILNLLWYFLFSCIIYNFKGLEKDWIENIISICLIYIFLFK